MKTRLDVQMKSETEVDVTIFDVIGDGFFGGVSPKEVDAALRKIPEAEQINVFINSPGGDVFAGMAIYNLLKMHKANVTVHVIGWAASAASVIAMAGDQIVMDDNAMMVIHDPWSCMCGTAAEFREAAESLDRIEGTIVATYAARTGQTAKTVAAMMEAETWMTAQEALDLGFATEIIAAKKAAAMIGGLTHFKNEPPQEVADRFERPEPKEPNGFINKAAAWLGLKGKPGGQPQRKEPENMATNPNDAPGAAAPPSMTAEQQAELTTGAVQTALSNERKRMGEIRSAVGDFPEIIAQAEQSDMDVTGAKALAFDAAKLVIVDLEGKLAASEKLVKAAADAGLTVPVDTGEETEDAPSAYEAAYDKHVAGGMKPAVARIEVARSHPEGHREWVASQQPPKREMPV